MARNVVRLRTSINWILKLPIPRDKKTCHDHGTMAYHGAETPHLLATVPRGHLQRHTTPREAATGEDAVQ